MTERNSERENNGRRHTQWEGLFVSEHAWDSNDDSVSDPQPMLSADEQQAILDMLIVAYDRKTTVFIQSWQDRHFQFHRCTIQELDCSQRVLTYEDPFGKWRLAIDSITSVHMLD
ncbi:YolD-like family protein [Planococcus sp. CAU13]|uniref:YolD-like family protein n=1 Tax=Planococcus sp. CAU13 TaxID=1541197 RepID=UPI00052FF7E9|nr:YolD-like family protein [Planococcus sp. CAU13]